VIGKYTSPLLLIGGGADALPVRYATSFQAPDPFLCLLKGSERHLLVSILELGRAQRLEGEVQCHTPDSLELPLSVRRNLGKQAVALIRHLGLKRVYVTPQCPVGVVREMEAGGLKVLLSPEPVFPSRMIKREDEIALMRESQRSAVAAMKRAVDVIHRAGVDEKGRLLNGSGKILTSEEVRLEIENVLLERQCAADDIIVAGGDQGVDPHERGFGPLRAGETIVLDIFPYSKKTGYWGDMTRTVIKGRPTRRQLHLYQTVLTAQRDAIRKLKPGVTGKEIHEGVIKCFENAGYETGMRNGVPQGFIHSTGHGVGLEIHEGPSIGPSGGPLKEGHVVTIEPGLYYLGIGGVRIEDTLVVTASGSSLLGRCRKVFEV